MLLSEIGDKEIIDISTGCKFGELWDAEMIFDERSGRIASLVLPAPDSGSRWSRSNDTVNLPWSSIIKIGPSIILFQSESRECDCNDCHI